MLGSVKGTPKREGTKALGSHGFYHVLAVSP